MRNPRSTSLMAFALATLAALSAGNRMAAAQGDPRIDGVLPHTLVTPDPNILLDPRTIKSGRPTATPATPTSTRAVTASAPAPASSTAPATATSPESAPAGPEATPATAPAASTEAATSTAPAQ